MERSMKRTAEDALRELQREVDALRVSKQSSMSSLHDDAVSDMSCM